MNSQILVNCGLQEIRVARIEQDEIQEIQIERSGESQYLGNIYQGKVVRVLPGMQSAFVDIGLERTAFLHVSDIWFPRQEDDVIPPIAQLIREGQLLTVQVLKDPVGTKGARLTTQISLAGRLLVYFPQDSHIGISQRIEDELLREELRVKVASLVDLQQGGYIVRTVAQNSSCERFKVDIEILNKLWAEIKQRAQESTQVALLFEDLCLTLRVLRDYVDINTDTIIVDNYDVVEKMRYFVSKYSSRGLPIIQYYDQNKPIFDHYGIEEEIERALARRVNLKSGGYLIFDQTEAMTTVDVNTGGFVGNNNFDETIFRTNLEAAAMIARQLRLRNLGGIIIIDFIDMGQELHQNKVLEELKKMMEVEHTHVSISGFTSLGLVEITRKRTRKSLVQQMCEICPVCAGRGVIKSTQTICHEILRELQRDFAQYNVNEYRVIASSMVVNEFLDTMDSQYNFFLEKFTQKVSFIAESSYAQEQFDIVLM